MAKGLFITGTDTGVGKSWVSAALIHALSQRGLRVAGMKPIASGCVQTPAGLRNEDALLLQHHASVAIDYETINPYAFAPAIAPHIAAQLAGQPIELETISHRYHQIATQADWVVVEGVGGWSVPIGPTTLLPTLVQQLRLPVVLVVGLKLGCINHALLSVAQIERDGLPLLGWVANSLEPAMAMEQYNITTLQQLIHAPLLGHTPFQPHSSIKQRSMQLEIEPILQQP